MEIQRKLFDLQDIAVTEFAGCRSKPWALITTGVVHIKLKESYCTACDTASMSQSLIASVVALLHEDNDLDARKALGQCNAIDLSIKVMNAPCWVKASHIELKELQTPFPRFVKSFLTREKSHFESPLAELKRINGIMTNVCPNCASPLSNAHSKGLLLAVTDQNGEALPEPIAAIASI